MSEKKSTTARRKAATKTKRRDPLQPYRAKAQIFIRLFFGKDTPDFVRDLLGSWYTQLESQTQIFWNTKAIAEIALPLMLKEADRIGLDVETPSSPFCLDSFGDSLTTNDREGRYQPRRSESDELQTELEKDAAAIARLLNSQYTPAKLHKGLSDALDEIQTGTHDNPAVLAVSYPLAVIREREREKEGKQ